jgi:hypothetical protein
MQRNTRNLLTTLVGAGALVLAASAPSFALVLPQKYKMNMGFLGEWSIVGGVEAALSGWNNAVPGEAAGCGGNCTGTPAPGVGGGINGDIDLTNAIFIISNDSFGSLPLSFDAWVGEPPQTPVIGYTSPNVAPNLYSSTGAHSKNFTGAASFAFKANVTWQTPLDWLSLTGGILPSPDGTEVGVGWFNPLPMLTDLNNMQTTVATGVQVNLTMPGDNSFYGILPGYASALSIRLADGYKTGKGLYELGFTGLWNLTPDGSDFIVGYGHTPLKRVGDDTHLQGGGGGGLNNFPVGGFGMWNSDLIGFGTVFNLTNRLVMNAEIETQWLPNGAIPADLRGTFGGRSQDYYRWSTQWTFAYDFGIKNIFGSPIRYGWAVQPSFTYQHGNSEDPNCNNFGNYLGLDVGSASPNNQANNTGDYGTFGCGSKMYALQLGPSFQLHNAFLRPTLAWTHLASVDPGFAYGNHGLDNDQVVVMLDFGWLLGKYQSGDEDQ